MGAADENQGVINWDSVLSAESEFQAADNQKLKTTRELNEQTAHRFTSYAGADIKAIVHFFDPTAPEAGKARIKILGDLQTLTISTHREKFPVRALGHVGPKGYTRGPRTIGGTLIFTVFDKTILSEMLIQGNQLEDAPIDNIGVLGAVLVDQIPPFDITIMFANETGSMSKLVIFGVELINEGQSMSIEDLITENVVTYVARHIMPMESLLDPYAVDFSKESKEIESKNWVNMTQDKKLRQLLAALE
jgi:hypothetical protein